MRKPLLHVLAALLLSGCAGLDFRYLDEERSDLLRLEHKPQYPPVRFCVFSDPHFFAPSLWRGSDGLDSHTAYKGKMFAWCEEILVETVEMVLAEGGDFLIVPGDMTKDGAVQSHEAMAALLETIAASGMQVFVIPGNHDILNPHAARYSGNDVVPVDHVTPGEFAAIYAPFGYGSAIARDTASLSYLAEPVDGLWLLALDSCTYGGNLDAGRSFTDGAFCQETVDWIEEILIDAVWQDKAVIAMLHHGALEHYPGQEIYDDSYVIDDFEAIARMLAFYNVRVAFSGHGHAQDIAMRTWPDEGKFFFDVETGSLLTFPSPVRTVHIDRSGRATIRSLFVEDVDGFGDGGVAFGDYARSDIFRSAAHLVFHKMRQFFVGEETSMIVADQVAEAFVAFIAGDEQRPEGEIFGRDGGGLIAWLIELKRRDYVEGLWTDTPPADNDVVIDLNSGVWN